MSAADDDLTFLFQMIRSSHPHSGSEEAHDAWDDAIDRGYKIVAALRARVDAADKLADAFITFGSHKRSCAVMQPPTLAREGLGVDCDCGFREALAAYEETAK